MNNYYLRLSDGYHWDSRMMEHEGNGTGTYQVRFVINGGRVDHRGPTRLARGKVLVDTRLLADTS